MYTAMPYEPIIDPTRPIEVDGMDTTLPAALNAAFTASIMPLSPIREQDIMHEFPNTWKPIGANKDEQDDSLDALAAGLHPLPATSQQLRDINSLPDRAIQLRKICDKYANADPIQRGYSEATERGWSRGVVVGARRDAVCCVQVSSSCVACDAESVRLL